IEIRARLTLNQPDDRAFGEVAEGTVSYHELRSARTEQLRSQAALGLAHRVLEAAKRIQRRGPGDRRRREQQQVLADRKLERRTRQVAAYDQLSANRHIVDTWRSRRPRAADGPRTS